MLIIYGFIIQERAEKELKKLQDTIKAKEADLQELKPKYEAQKKKEEDCTREYDVYLTIMNLY